MSDSLTDDTVQAPASNEPTGQGNEQVVTAEQSQGSQEQVPSDATNQQNNGGSQEQQVPDDSLAKFAKSQGIDDLSTLSDREQKLLKIASDNQKAYRQQSNQPKITDAASELNKPADDATEVQKLASKVAAFEYANTTNQFWSGDGKDRTLEPTMIQVLNEKKEQFGKEYAFSLSQDLDTLYAMAQIKSGAVDTTAAIEEGRRQERDSIRQQSSAGAPQSHATQPNTGSAKINMDWVNSEYDSTNPEHRKALDEALQRGDLY